MPREKAMRWWFYSRSVTDKIYRLHSSGDEPLRPKGAEGKHLDRPEVVLEADPGWTTIIEGKWKLHKLSGSKREEEIQLYDIFADPGETRNMAGQNPQIVATLDAKLSAWRESVVASLKGKDREVQAEISLLKQNDS
jgi:hypothetical protein